MKQRLHHLRLRIYLLVNRNTVLFIAGLGGVIHETLLQHGERPTLLILFATMMGLPAFLSPTETGGVGFGHLRTKSNNKNDEDSNDEEKKDKTP